jgi:hypothetical protein
MVQFSELDTEGTMSSPFSVDPHLVPDTLTTRPVNGRQIDDLISGRANVVYYLPINFVLQQLLRSTFVVS